LCLNSGIQQQQEHQYQKHEEQRSRDPEPFTLFAEAYHFQRRRKRLRTSRNVARKPRFEGVKTVQMVGRNRSRTI
jgi:hypothetical protein